jgi:hypothetical protein
MKIRQALKIRKRCFLNVQYYDNYTPKDLNYKQSTKDKSWDLFWSLPYRNNLTRTWVKKFLTK